MILDELGKERNLNYLYHSSIIHIFHTKIYVIMIIYVDRKANILKIVHTYFIHIMWPKLPK